APADSIPQLFTVKRPNIIFIVLESFMSKVIEPLGGLPNVATTMNRLCGEAILFNNMYGNSFRTDRGLVSIFSGYPAQPTTSIMKYPAKSQHLPSIPKSLKETGYDLSFFYGGDADFTNMRSYFVSMGIDKIVSDKDFPVKDRMMKWGAHDEFVFRKLSDDLRTEQKEPFCKILLTLSSHEPFDVPFHRLDHEYLNSVAYTDSCLGVFIDDLKKTKYWDNTVLILVPDHAMRYPYDIPNASAERYQIPLLFAGGAIKEPCIIETVGSQIDLAATLLTQLGIDRSEYIFSKDLLNPNAPHFAFYTFKDGFGFITPDGKGIFDCESGQPFEETGTEAKRNIEKGKALLQSLYNDLENR
ncbi:MAG: LTA synthase family protein, partial [Bacteroidaceae bacterium]|nr:LTA synthase family protein [Bacteroidaceae bacterium]